MITPATITQTQTDLSAAAQKLNNRLTSFALTPQSDTLIQSLINDMEHFAALMNSEASSPIPTLGGNASP